MDTRFQPVAPEAIADNAVKLIGTDWMLITAGTLESYNMMTASWGGLGVLWNRPVAYTFIRPQRRTRAFADASDWFTLTFFDEKHRDTLNLLGTRSGRDIDKMRLDGLTAFETPAGSVGFSEARLVMECRKIYFDDIDPAHFLVPEIAECYPAADYHRMYIGHITGCWAAR
jgi:flavin reductase (DIM6/NTAB) family NADH-FMN oxidoreductase RutF